MTDETADFIERLSQRGVEPALGNVTAKIRFDVIDNDGVSRWLVEINEGRLTVSSSEGPADCVLTAERRVFDALASGRMNAVAALVRGEVSASGDPNVLVLAQRLFPDPPRTGEHEPVVAGGWRVP